LDNTGSGTGPELKFGGSAVIAGQFGTWTPIGAVQVAGGSYDIAWHDTSSGLYSIWSIDSNGNYVSNLANSVAGNSTTLESFETIFGQDLNGDGHIGPPPPPPPTVIQTDGTTALTEVGNNFFLDNTGSGTGPELKFGGSAVIAGQFGTWTPIGAVQVAGGSYDIAWHDTSSGLYSIWSLDSNGNYLSNLANSVAGNSTTLESFETIFGQDLNGDGHIGIPTTSTATSSSAANSTPDNFHFAGDGSGNPHALAFSVRPNGAMGPTGTMHGGIPAMEAQDAFAFAAANFTPATANMPFNNANSHAAPTGSHEDTFGGSAIHEATQAAHWFAHHSDFHFV
jgi:hypothetical protein